MCHERIGTSWRRKKFKLRPQNRIAAPLRDSFQNFGQAPPHFKWESPKNKRCVDLS